MDLVRASSKSPSLLGGLVDTCVGLRDNSEVDELNDDGDRDISSFGSREPYVSFMAVLSSFVGGLFCAASRGSFSLSAIF